MHKRLIALMLALVGLFAFVMPSQVSAQETFCYIFNFDGGAYSGSLSLEQGSYETDLIFGDSYYIPTLQSDGQYRLGLRYAPFGGVGFYSRVTKATLGVTYPETNQTTLLAVQVESFGLKAGWTNDDLASTDKLYFTSYYNGNFSNYANYNSPEYSLEYEGNLTVESLAPEGWHNQMYIAMRSPSSGAKLHTLRMEGFGSSPFGSSNCDFVTSPTSTPTATLGFPPTSTATASPTATTTATATNTPTPTNTPGTYDWCVVFNFADDDSGWYAPVSPLAVSPGGETSSFGTWNGTALVSTTEKHARSGGGQYIYADGIAYQYDFPSNYDFVGIEVHGEYTEGENSDNHSLPHGTELVFSVNGSYTTANLKSSISGEYFYSQFYTLNDGNGITLTSMNSYGSFSSGAPDPLGSSRIDYVIVYGKNTAPANASPYCSVATPTPTLTPSPSPTYTPTTTATPYPECGFVNSSFNSGDSGWVNTGGLVVPGAIELEDSEGLSQDMNIPPGDYKSVVRASAVYSGSGNAEIFVFENLDSLAASMGTYSNIEFSNGGGSLVYEDDFTLATGGSRTFSFSADLDGSMTAIRIESICIYATGEGADTGNSENIGDSWVCGAVQSSVGFLAGFVNQEYGDLLGSYLCESLGGSGSGGDGVFAYTCGETITPPALSVFEIGNWIIFLAKALLQWFNCVLYPLVQSILGALLSFIGMVFSFIGWFFTKFLGWILGLVANFVAMATYAFFNFGTAFLNGLLQLGLILVRIVNIIRLFFIRALAFLAVIGFTIQSILNAWDSSGTMAIGIQLHDCVARPLESDLCAFYYIAENTILAPPVGWLIIPFLIAIFYVTSGLYLVDIVAKFVSMIKRSGD